jgi:hypothetical protein
VRQTPDDAAAGAHEHGAPVLSRGGGTNLSAVHWRCAGVSGGDRYGTVDPDELNALRGLRGAVGRRASLLVACLLSAGSCRARRRRGDRCRARPRRHVGWNTAGLNLSAASTVAASAIAFTTAHGSASRFGSWRRCAAHCPFCTKSRKTTSSTASRRRVPPLRGPSCASFLATVERLVRLQRGDGHLVLRHPLLATGRGVRGPRPNVPGELLFLPGSLCPQPVRSRARRVHTDRVDHPSTPTTPAPSTSTLSPLAYLREPGIEPCSGKDAPASSSRTECTRIPTPAAEERRSRRWPVRVRRVALRVVARPAVRAGSTSDRGTHHYPVAPGESAHRRAHVLDHADRLVAQNRARLHARHRAANQMQVRTANRPTRDPDESVARLEDLGV